MGKNCTAHDSNDVLMDRYANIDLIKFLGMLFVLVYHCTTVKIDILEDSSVSTYINFLVRPILSVCVPLFFFANGFLLINKTLDMKKHLIKTVRLIILTGIWGMLTLLFLMPIEGEWLSIKEFVIALWDLKMDWINHLWYMGALICIYFIFPLIKIAFDYHRDIFNYWVGICFLFAFGNTAIGMLVTFLSYQIRGGNIYYFDNFFNMFNPFRGLYGHTFAYFSIGCLVGGNQTLINEKIHRYRFINQRSLLLLITVSTLLLGLWGIFSTKLTGSLWDVVWNGYDTIFTCINVVAIYILSNSYRSHSGLLSKYIETVSQNTLGIYFIHEIFRPLFLKLGVRNIPFAGNYIFDIMYALFLMTLSLFITLLMKRITVLKKLVM